MRGVRGRARHPAEPCGGGVATFTIFTQGPGGFMSKLHHRMPVILQPELEDEWLEPAIDDPKSILDILARNNGMELEAHPVSRLVNKPNQETKALIEPV
jgi:putative SOS response-associated peptidase YedK